MARVLHTGPMQQPAAVIEALTDTNPYRPEPPHEVDDEQKVADLVRQMSAHGWQGAPLVVHGDTAVTGSHRITAAREVLDATGREVQIPRVEIADVCDAYGIDWDAVMDEADMDVLTAAQMVADRLPADVVDYLGMDLH